MELRDYQREAVESVWAYLRAREDNPCVVLPTGCHAVDHPILMYDGTIRKVQDIRVGDQIMGDDSTPRIVLALCRGREPLYRIVPRRGTPFVVNAGHVLSLVSTNEGKRKFDCYQVGGEITNITLREYLGKSKSWKHLRKLYHVPVDFPVSADLPLPPYILGLLLGDGSLVNGVALTSADEELGEAFIRYADSVECDVRVSENTSGVATYHLLGRKGIYNLPFDTLEALGLRGHTSYSKFVPSMYLTASRADRLQLLAGLLDSDRHLEHVFDFITQSRDLANDTVFLARSLGFMAHAREKYCACQTGAGDWYYRVGISGDLSAIPCRRKRHTEAQRPRKMKKDVLRTGFTVEPLDVGDYYGFTLDGNHLYVDGNFFVHHNSGKSLVLAEICRQAVAEWGGRALVVTHVAELVEQNAAKLRAMLGSESVGVYSAGLKRRDLTHLVIAAGIQSIYKKACDLGPFNLIVVDEVHLIPPGGDGMYLSFLCDARIINPHMRVIGLTATPYRMTTGEICSPDGILNHVCYEAGVKNLIKAGYLSPLISKAGRQKADVSGLHLRGGEFIAGEAEDLMDADALVKSAVAEIVEATRDRRACLIFCAGIKHGEHVARVFREEHGIECGFIDGHTPGYLRARLIARFRGEIQPSTLFEEPQQPLKYLANVNVLTTGFDCPHIDCVAMLRPTNSPGLYYQQCGRGFRLAEGKSNCLVLDFAQNIVRHGPVDMLKAGDRPLKGSGEAPHRECPECRTVCHASLAACPSCGFVFPKAEKPKHEAHASEAPIISEEANGEPREFEVLETIYAVHNKKNAQPGHPPSLRVSHRVGGYSDWFSEWVCPEHGGYARDKFMTWWGKRSLYPAPRTVADALRLANEGCLAKTHAIRVKHDQDGFDRIIAWALDDPPEPDDDRLTGEREAAGEPVAAAAPADPWATDDIPF